MLFLLVLLLCCAMVAHAAERRPVRSDYASEMERAHAERGLPAADIDWDLRSCIAELVTMYHAQLRRKPLDQPKSPKAKALLDEFELQLPKAMAARVLQAMRGAIECDQAAPALAVDDGFEYVYYGEGGATMRKCRDCECLIAGRPALATPAR